MDVDFASCALIMQQGHMCYRATRTDEPLCNKSLCVRVQQEHMCVQQERVCPLVQQEHMCTCAARACVPWLQNSTCGLVEQERITQTSNIKGTPPPLDLINTEF